MSYSPINWKNAPDAKTTPLSAENLNHMEEGIINNDAAITELTKTVETNAEEISSLNDTLTNQLGGFTPVIDEFTGEITGYKTTIGGADTVFPFSSDPSKDYVYIIKNGEYQDGYTFTPNSAISQDDRKANRRLWYGVANSDGGPKIYTTFDITDYEYVVLHDFIESGNTGSYNAPNGHITIYDSTGSTILAIVSMNDRENGYRKDIKIDVSNIEGTVRLGWYCTARPDTGYPFFLVKDLYLIPKKKKKEPLYLYRNGTISSIDDTDIEMYLYSMTETDSALQTTSVAYSGFNTTAICGYTKAYFKIRQESTTAKCRYGVCRIWSVSMPTVVSSGTGRTNYTDITPTSESVVYELDLIQGRGIYFGTLSATTGIYIEEIWLE